jgi:dihydroxyacetone kinase-like protein
VTDLTVTQLKAAAQRIATAAKAASDELNTADGQLGDGDLGITVSDGWREATIDMGNAPVDIGLALLACSKAFQRVSPSSFGTLTATALMAAAKQTKGRAGIPWSEISSLVASARDAMMARGKGALGDKSVLDALDAVATATAGLDEPGSILAAADRATDDALRAFRDRPAKLGRARMFGEKSIGLDDPGMLAFRRMLDGLVKP